MKVKIGIRGISVGRNHLHRLVLIFYSTTLSQPPSCDTLPSNIQIHDFFQVFLNFES
jgi:hypothetical protein